MPPMHPSRPKRPCRGRERPFVEPKKPRGGAAAAGGMGRSAVGMGPGVGGTHMSVGGSPGGGAGTSPAAGIKGVGRGRKRDALPGELLEAVVDARTKAALASAEAALAAADSSDVSVFAVPAPTSLPSSPTSVSSPPASHTLSEKERDILSPVVVLEEDKQLLAASGKKTPTGRMSAAANRKARAQAAAATRAAKAAKAAQLAQQAKAARAQQLSLAVKKDEEPEIQIVEDTGDESTNIPATPPRSKDSEDQPTTPASVFFSTPVATSSPLTVFGKGSVPAGIDRKEGETEDGAAASPAPVPVVVLDEETRMSADISAIDGDSEAVAESVEADSRPTTPPGHSLLPPSDKTPLPPPTLTGDASAMEVEMIREGEEAQQGINTGTPTVAATPVAGAVPGGEESQGSVISSATADSTPGVRRNKCRMEVCDPDAKEFSVDMLAEYQWPPGRTGEPLMLQEQVAEYLGVKSFKRKYPDVQRRVVEAEEKTFLREKGLVSDNLSDLGLTAISSVEVLDIMFTDFPEKYEEYRKHLRERQAKEMSLKQKLIAVTSNAEKSRLDYRERATSSAASWNAKFNRARRDQRRASFDLQNLTVHFPATRVKKMKREVPKLGDYPIALIPGQFTDFYKSYTPAELRYFPLNTVLYGPMKPNERHEPGGGSDGSQSDSDDSSSSDESSSSSSSEGTQDTEETGSTAGETETAEGGGGSSTGNTVVKAEGGGTAPQEGTQNAAQVNGRSPVVNGGNSTEKNAIKEEAAICKVCGGDKNRNKEGNAEVLIHCGTCTSSCHPTCLDLTLDMVPHIKKYNWQCTDCKICIQCKDPADEDKMLFCDMCDRGYHIYCVGLRRVPSGRWHCRECAVCGSCGAREPGPGPDATWQHEYKKADKGSPGPANARVYAQTLCIACSKLWRRGRYCQLCWRCFDAKTDDDASLITCSVCDKMMHPECCNAVGGVELDRANFLCEICQEKGHQGRPSSLKLSMRPVVKLTYIDGY